MYSYIYICVCVFMCMQIALLFQFKRKIRENVRRVFRRLKLRYVFFLKKTHTNIGLCEYTYAWYIHIYMYMYVCIQLYIFMWHTTKFVSRKYVCMCICIYLGLYIYRSKRSTNYLTRSWLTVMRCLCSCSCYCTSNIYNNYRFIIFVYIRLEYLLYTICIVYIYIQT